MRSLALPLVLLLAACQSVRVATDHDPRADFSRMRTYAWAPREKPVNPLAANTLAINRVHDAIDRALAARGLRAAAAGRPDFVVDFATTSRGRLDVVAWPTWGVRWRRGGWTDVETIEYVDGTLVIGLLDPATNELIWRGAGTEVLDDDSGGEERVDEIVRAVLAEFPPRAK